LERHFSSWSGTTAFAQGTKSITDRNQACVTSNNKAGFAPIILARILRKKQTTADIGGGCRLS
jgi:hypothetical protein